jgi:hypothetical protein
VDPLAGFGASSPTYFLHGRIRNRSAHTLNSITLRVQFYQTDGSPDILGDKTVRIQVNVPAHQTREISWPISFEGAPQLTEYAWKYAITEIRGGQNGRTTSWTTKCTAFAPTQQQWAIVAVKLAGNGA